MADSDTHGERVPICCQHTGKLLARVDWDQKKLYLWCKSATCKEWHEFDLDDLSQQHKEATQHVA